MAAGWTLILYIVSVATETVGVGHCRSVRRPQVTGRHPDGPRRTLVVRGLLREGADQVGDADHAQAAADFVDDYQVVVDALL